MSSNNIEDGINGYYLYPGSINKLHAENITTIEQLRKLSNRKLQFMWGVGKSTLYNITCFLNLLNKENQS